MKVTTKLLVVGLIIIIFTSIFILFFNTDRLIPDNPEGKTSYYTMIINDNSQLNSRNRYEHRLNAYNKRGEVKELIFTSSKQLREGAYLELYVAPFRGVTYWQEVQLDELPDLVKSIYTE